MKRCDNCSERIVFGGISEGGGLYCKEECYDAALVERGKRISDDLVFQQAHAQRDSDCPICKGPGPVDVHRAESLLCGFVIYQSKKERFLACKKCAVAKQRRYLITTALFGWWGFGILMAPIVILKNLEWMLAPAPALPSAELVELVRYNLAKRLPAVATSPG